MDRLVGRCSSPGSDTEARAGGEAVAAPRRSAAQSPLRKAAMHAHNRYAGAACGRDNNMRRRNNHNFQARSDSTLVGAEARNWMCDYAKSMAWRSGSCKSSGGNPSCSGRPQCLAGRGRRRLPDVRSYRKGKRLGSFAITRPGSGSGPAAGVGHAQPNAQIQPLAAQLRTLASVIVGPGAGGAHTSTRSRTALVARRLRIPAQRVGRLRRTVPGMLRAPAAHGCGWPVDTNLVSQHGAAQRSGSVVDARFSLLGKSFATQPTRRESGTRLTMYSVLASTASQSMSNIPLSAHPSYYLGSLLWALVYNKT